MAQRKWVYKPRKPEDLRRRAQQTSGAGRSYIVEGVEFWSPREGENRVRILPPTWDDPEHYGYDVWVHYGIGPDRAAFLCLRMRDEPCPICQERIRASASGDEEYANSLKPTKRVLAWILDRNSTEQVPLLWPMPYTLDAEFAKLAQTEEGEILQVDDPLHGYDVLFRREGQGTRTKYTACRIARNSSPVANSKAELKEILQFVIDRPLPSLLVFRGPDEMRAAFVAEPAAEEQQVDEPAHKQEMSEVFSGREKPSLRNDAGAKDESAEEVDADDLDDFLAGLGA